MLKQIIPVQGTPWNAPVKCWDGEARHPQCLALTCDGAVVAMVYRDPEPESIYSLVLNPVLVRADSGEVK